MRTLAILHMSQGKKAVKRKKKSKNKVKQIKSLVIKMLPLISSLMIANLSLKRGSLAAILLPNSSITF